MKIAVASWLVHSTQGWADQPWALARGIVFLGNIFLITLAVPLSTQVYKWVLAI